MINGVIQKTHNKQHVVEYLRSENSIINCPKKIADTFGTYFSEIGQKLGANIKSPKTKAKTYIGKIPVNNKSLFLYPTTEREIELIIEKLPNKSSSGHDEISNNLLKKIGKSILQPLQIIFNNSMTEGEFPDAMKLANVVPLHKTKSRDLVTNYRPISLLLTMSKVLEKIIYK